MQIGHWSLERAMERINSSKRKRESPDEDEVGERKAAQDDAKNVVNQVRLQPHFNAYLGGLE